MNGKDPSLLFKGLAVVSALAIGGGYVAYKEASAEKAKKLERALRAQRMLEAEAEQSAFIVGSKSIGMPLFTKAVGDFVTPIEGTGKAEDKLLLPSSKIGIIAEEEEPAGEKPPRLMPGSKSINLLLDNPNRTKSK